MNDRPVDIRAINRESAETRKLALMGAVQGLIQKLAIPVEQQDEMLRRFDHAIHAVDTAKVFRDIGQLPHAVDVDMDNNPLMRPKNLEHNENDAVQFYIMANILEDLKAIVAVQAELSFVDDYNQVVAKFNSIAAISDNKGVAELDKGDALIYEFNRVCEQYREAYHETITDDARAGFEKFIRRQPLSTIESDNLNDFIDTYHLNTGKEFSKISPIVLKFQKWQMQMLAERLVDRLPNRHEINSNSLVIPPFKFNPRSSELPKRQSQIDEQQSEKRQRKRFNSTIVQKMDDRNIPFLLTNSNNPHEFLLYQMKSNGKLQTDRFTFEGNLGKNRPEDSTTFAEASASIINTNQNYQHMRSMAEKIWLDIHNEAMPANQWQEIVISANQNSTDYIKSRLNTQPFVITPDSEGVVNLHYLDKQRNYQVARIAENTQEYKNIQIVGGGDYRNILSDLRMDRDLKQPVLTRWQQYKANVKSAWENFKKVSKERPFRMALTLGLIAIGVAAAITAIVFSAGIASVPVAVGVSAGLGALTASGGVALGVGGAIAGLALAVGAVGVEFRRRKSEDALQKTRQQLQMHGADSTNTVVQTLGSNKSTAPAPAAIEPVVEAKVVAPKADSVISDNHQPTRTFRKQ